jgi:hypothetical protein
MFQAALFSKWETGERTWLQSSNEPLEFEEKPVILQKGIVPCDNLQLLEFELVPPPPEPVEFEWLSSD